MSEVIKSKLKKLFQKAKKRKKKSNNVVPFKQNLRVVSKIENPVSLEEAETKRVNEYAKDYCREIEKFANEARISAGMVYYHFLFHMKQIAIFNLNYSEYRNINVYSSKELNRNHGDMLSEQFPELGLEKKKEETDTVH